jgi:prepilin-type N-terminal cleavage/methylation domain-containing protein
MKRHSSHGFTLIEVLTVIVIILIIAGWVISAFGPANKKAAEARAKSEIQMISAACESYKADNGEYPREEGKTEGSSNGGSPIDPRVHANPTSGNYKQSTLALYKLISGDANADNRIDQDAKVYLNFQNNKNMIGGTRNSQQQVSQVQFLQDPFGNSYGYCTAGSRAAEEARNKASGGNNQNAKQAGYNASFDLWSTAGKVATSGTPSDQDRMVWIKNW